jgi:hypothetical protein
MDVWELNPKLGSLWLKASATFGGGSVRLKATMSGCRRAVLLFIYTLALALQLRKSTENLSHGSRTLLDTACCVDLAALCGWPRLASCTSVLSVDFEGLQTALGRRTCVTARCGIPSREKPTADIAVLPLPPLHIDLHGLYPLLRSLPISMPNLP